MSKTVTLYVKDRKVWKQARREAREQGRSLSDVVEALVRGWIESQTRNGFCDNNDMRGFICTRPRNHKGEHMAHGDDRVMVASWSEI